MPALSFGSVCSGIGAPECAWEPLGWRCAWLSEIEPFPSAVLAHHYPAVPNLGDMRKLPARVAAGEIEAPDILVGGTPCQSFSCAGLREGLADPRGNLTRTFVELADAIDKRRIEMAKPPCVVLWENVPGIFSDDTNAFGCLLGGLAGASAPLVPTRKWPRAGMVVGPRRRVAWCVLDAQFFGVPQRRRRVFVLAVPAAADARGHPGARVLDPSAILALGQGVRGDPSPRAVAGERTAGGAAARTRGGGGLGTDAECDGALITTAVTAHMAKGGASGAGDGEERGLIASVTPGAALPCVSSKWSKGSGGPAGDEAYNLVAHSLRADGFDASEDGTGRGTPLVAGTLRVGPSSKASHGKRSGSDRDTLIPTVCPTLRAGGNRTGGDRPPGTDVDTADSLIPFDTTQIPLATGAHPPAVAFQCQGTNVGEMETLRGGNGNVTGGVPFLPIAFHLTQDPICGDPTPVLSSGNGQGCATLGVAQPMPFDWKQIGHPANHSNPHAGDPCHPLRGTANAEPAVLLPACGVRRLTPTECARLQNFPDDWLDITYRGKPAADGNKYRTLGNSMCVLVMRWLGKRIAAVYRPVRRQLPPEKSSGQCGKPLQLQPTALNANERAVLGALTTSLRPTTIRDLARFCFPDQTPRRANSWVRNALRRLVRARLVVRADSGTYATPARAPGALAPGAAAPRTGRRAPPRG